MKITGIILAGGKSSRMGTDKALLQINGHSFLQHCHDVLIKLCDEIIISSSNQAHELNNTLRVADIYPEKGPLGGLHATLSASKNDINLCLSVDTPFVTVDFLRWMLNQQKDDKSFFIKEGGRFHPLIGVYHKSAVALTEVALKNNSLRTTELVKHLPHDWQHLEVYGDYNFGMLANINTQEEYEKALKR
jgi:molybdopterin-guanine dinucleotide biosynthesis protein A